MLPAGGVGVKWTTLTFEAVAPEEVTEEFLVALLDVCDEHGLDAEGIGIDRRESSGETEGQ